MLDLTSYHGKATRYVNILDKQEAFFSVCQVFKPCTINH